MGMEGSFSETYEILGKLGEGSGGIVYKAYHKRLRQEVVLKKVRNRGMSYAASRQEVDILKKLHHSYLPQVFDFLEIDGSVYTVMSYVQGKSFAQLIKEGHKFTQQQLIRWGMQISSALNCLHSQKPPVIHGDIKPANIMLTKEGDICLIDFNISFFLDGTPMLGYTNGYSSPEQKSIALSHGKTKIVLDEKSDIYSVGATLYYLALKKKYDDQNPDFVALENQTSETFAAIVKKALSFYKEERYQSALEMFQALKSIPKHDQRYLQLVRNHRYQQIGLSLLLAGSIALGGFGIHTMKLERVEKYNELVASQKEYRLDQNYDKQTELFKEARDLLPGSLESYYQNALALYQQQEYQECIDFIDYDVLNNERIDTDQERIGDFYGVGANCYFELEDYQNSVDYFEKAIDYLGYDEDYYRDYVIALAYNDELEKANEKLDEAIEHGLGDDSMYFAKGEINKSLGNDSVAIENFEQCLQLTDNDELKERSYILMGDIYINNEELIEAHDVLLEGVETLPTLHQMIVLERLIQVDIDINTPVYQQEAIEKLQQVIDNNWDSYDTYDNLVILYQKLNQYDKVEENLDYMLKTFGEDYNIYKRYAFLEISLQEAKENSQRDYQQFEEYYQEAKDLYQENSTNDPEMALLDSVYQQVVSGGWL